MTSSDLFHHLLLSCFEWGILWIEHFERHVLQVCSDTSVLKAIGNCCHPKAIIKYLVWRESPGSAFRVFLVSYTMICFTWPTFDFILFYFLPIHSWLFFNIGTPEAGAASRAIWVFPGFDATRGCLEHVHSGPDCPGDLFSHRKPLSPGQLLSQHGWI